MAAGEDTARAARLDTAGRLDDYAQERPARAVMLAHGQNVEAVQAEEQIAARNQGGSAQQRTP